MDALRQEYLSQIKILEKRLAQLRSEPAKYGMEWERHKKRIISLEIMVEDLYFALNEMRR